MSYKLLNDDGDGVEGQAVITLSPQGEVRSSVVNGHAVVMVTALEVELGLNQTVVVHVEVGYAKKKKSSFLVRLLWV